MASPAAAPAMATLPLSLLIHIDYGSSLAPRVISLNGSDTWLAQCPLVGRTMGVADLDRYGVRFATFGADVVEPGHDELRTIPLAALGIANVGWTAHCAAPADIRPIRKKRTAAGKDEKSESKSASDKFAGLTPTNIIPKLRSAKGGARRVALEYMDRHWRDVIKAAQRDFASLSVETLCDIFKSDNLSANEIDVFDVALTWCRAHTDNKDSPDSMRATITPLLPHIRLPLISATEMALRVSPSKILLPEQELGLYSYIATQAEVKARAARGDVKEPPAKVAGFLTKRRKAFGTSFTFDPNNKGPSIVLSNGNRTLTGGASHVAGCATGTETLSNGVHYWEVRVDRGRASGHHYLGLVTPGVTMAGDLCRPGTFGWWYDGAAGVPGPLATNPTGSFRFSAGQSVGLLLDFDRHLLQMYVNKQWTGEVSITDGVSFLPAFGCYGSADQFTLIEDPEWPQIHK